MTEIDRHSRTWAAIEKWAEAEIEKHRDALESRTDPDAHGRLRQLRALLRLVEPPKPRQTTGATDTYT